MRTHDENELCAYMKVDLKKTPSLLSKAADFVMVAAQSQLTTTQDVLNVVNKIKDVAGKTLNASSETLQGIQIFKSDVGTRSPGIATSAGAPFFQLNGETITRTVHKVGTSQLTKVAKDHINELLPEAEGALGTMANGAVVGAAIGLTTSAIKNFMRYNNGEITKEEAYLEIGQSVVQKTVYGAAMAGVKMLLPVTGVAGVAIGVYVNAVLKNVLDEVFGKGAYREILIAGGYTMGTAMNLAEALEQFKKDRKVVAAYNQSTEQKLDHAENILNMLAERRRNQ
jgi:hypothetical protein